MLGKHCGKVVAGVVPGGTILRFTGRQRQALGIRVRDLATYGAAALVFGQFVGERVVSWRLILVGVLFWIASVASALAIEGEQQWRTRY